MLKRILSLLAALCLLCTAALAEDAPADASASITLDNAPSAMAAMNDHLYIAAYTSMGNGLLRQTEAAPPADSSVMTGAPGSAGSSPAGMTTSTSAPRWAS